MRFEDTICAPATSLGGAICVIRMSGPQTFGIVDSIVRFRKGDAASSKGYTLKFGTIHDGAQLLDEVVVSIFRAPASYTGEDSVEISCHASSYIVGRILALLVDNGARMAGPGEFTQRAFVAGKMDLSQAEAVADVISSGSAYAHKVAMNQLKGGYSHELMLLRDKLVELASLMELELDFSEEEVEFADRSHLYSLLDSAVSQIDRLAASFSVGNAIKNGVPVAIVGAANSGKSTLLNALLGEERAIVSPIAGTTRDTIEEVMVLDGIQFRFIDTAGIRETSDFVEKAGIERSWQKLERADVVLAVLDLTSADWQLAASEIMEHAREEQEVILVGNKVDVAQEYAAACGEAESLEKVEVCAEGYCDGQASIAEARVLPISAKTGAGLDELRSLIVSSQRRRIDESGTLVTNYRHYEALRTASRDLSAVRTALQSSLPTDLVAEDLRSAITSLNAIFGQSAISTETLLGEIFGRFCIGK